MSSRVPLGAVRALRVLQLPAAASRDDHDDAKSSDERRPTVAVTSPRWTPLDALESPRASAAVAAPARYETPEEFVAALSAFAAVALGRRRSADPVSRAAHDRLENDARWAHARGATIRFAPSPDARAARARFTFELMSTDVMVPLCPTGTNRSHEAHAALRDLGVTSTIALPHATLASADRTGGPRCLRDTPALVRLSGAWFEKTRRVVYVAFGAAAGDLVGFMRRQCGEGADLRSVHIIALPDRNTIPDISTVGAAAVHAARAEMRENIAAIFRPCV